MMASSRDRNRSSSWDGSGFGRIGCLLNQPEEHAIMNRIKTEDSSYASARNRKLLAEWVAKAGENEYAEPALNPCQTTAYAFFTGDKLPWKATEEERAIVCVLRRTTGFPLDDLTFVVTHFLPHLNRDAV